ncbi:MAG: TlpA disulfide reductase family protein [Flavobacterium sp.]
MQRRLILAILFACGLSFTYSQPTTGPAYPVIGKPCPDFNFNDVTNYRRESISLKDYSDSYLIIEFWSTHCISCIENFEHLNKVAERFKEKLNVLLVATDEQSSRAVYEKFRKKLSLMLPNAYDNMIFERFGIESVPHFVWVNNKGIVKYITSVEEVTDENIKSFIEGKEMKLPETSSFFSEKSEIPFDYGQTFLVNGNGGNDSNFLFRTLLASWNVKLRVLYNGYFKTMPQKPNEISIIGASVGKLYELAYYERKYAIPLLPDNNYGKYWIRPILKVKDSSVFNADYSSGKNVFCFSLKVQSSKASDSSMQKILQSELKNYFGYKVAIEERLMPCWKLTATKKAIKELKSKGGDAAFDGNLLSGFSLKNEPVYELIRALWAPHQDEPPFIDATGINGNIDLAVESGVSDLADLIAELKTKGLLLSKGKKLMKVLVLSD